MESLPEVNQTAEKVMGESCPKAIEGACGCKEPQHIFIGNEWVTDDIEGSRLFCKGCDHTWFEL